MNDLHCTPSSISMAARPQCTIIGAGIVGICAGIALVKRGYCVTILDHNPPGSQTSRGNAGGFGVTEVVPIAGPGVVRKIPGWLFDPYGPLSIRWSHFPKLVPWLRRFHGVSNQADHDEIAKSLGAILKRCTADTRNLVDAARLDHLMTYKGAITVYGSLKGFRQSEQEWRLRAHLGIELEYLDERRLRQLEPALENVEHGWLMPEWFNTIDPHRLSLGLACYFQRLGGKIMEKKVVGFAINQGRVSHIEDEKGLHSIVDTLLISAGVWSGALCQRLGERVLLEAERGYNATIEDPGIYLDRQIIFGEEKFVVSNIGNGLRIGGAAEFAGISAPANYKRSRRLVDIAKTYLPQLNIESSQPWMGQRPSTPDSLPVIGGSTLFDNVFHAFGHGHLGLTMAATTGELIAGKINDETVPIELKPFSIDRFQSG